VDVLGDLGQEGLGYGYLFHFGTPKELKFSKKIGRGRGGYP
jgi:hypothetical protein